LIELAKNTKRIASYYAAQCHWPLRQHDRWWGTGAPTVQQPQLSVTLVPISISFVDTLRQFPLISISIQHYAIFKRNKLLLILSQ
jgi:hypothetical protein